VLSWPQVSHEQNGRCNPAGAGGAKRRLPAGGRPEGALQATEKYLSRFKGIEDPKRRTYAAMVSAVDDDVGRLLAELKASGLEEDTIVFFLSDNGGPTSNASNNFPLRGNKSSVWEGGFRVPFAVKWPGALPEGEVYAKPVSSLDIFATIATAAGAKPDPVRPLDGVDLIPFLTGKETAAPHDTIYLRKIQQHAFAVRGGSHKLVIPTEGGKPLLFDLDKGIGEKTDLSDSEPAILADLEKRRAEWNGELIDPVFGPGITGPPEIKPKKKKSDRRDQVFREDSNAAIIRLAFTAVSAGVSPAQ
jgi:arylsulfatase A-like enzyme